MRRADYSSRGALPSVACLNVIVNCLKNNQHDVTCGLSFIFMGSRHSFSTCFELSGSSSSGAEHVGEREGYSKDYTLYQRLTVQEK